MADDTEELITLAIDKMAASMAESWDGPVEWAATADAVAEVIACYGNIFSDMHLMGMLAFAAMARRQAAMSSPNGQEASA